MDTKGYYEFTCVSPKIYTITLRTAHAELTFEELCDAFRAFALATGYHPDTVRAMFKLIAGDAAQTKKKDKRV